MIIITIAACMSSFFSKLSLEIVFFGSNIQCTFLSHHLSNREEFALIKCQLFRILFCTCHRLWFHVHGKIQRNSSKNIQLISHAWFIWYAMKKRIRFRTEFIDGVNIFGASFHSLKSSQTPTKLSWYLLQPLHQPRTALRKQRRKYLLWSSSQRTSMIYLQWCYRQKCAHNHTLPLHTKSSPTQFTMQKYQLKEPSNKVVNPTCTNKWRK